MLPLAPPPVSSPAKIGVAGDGLADLVLTPD